MSNQFIKRAQHYIDTYRGVPHSAWLAIALTLLQSIAIGICYFISIYFVNTLHMSVAQAGILLSCYGVGTILGGYVSGKLVDRYAPSRIVLMSILIEAIAFFTLSQLSTMLPFMITLFILGIAFYGFKTANDVWMLDQCLGNHSLRLKVVNVSRAAMNLGMGLTGVIIGVFAQYGFEYIFYFFALTLGFAGLYLLMRRSQPLPHHHQSHPQQNKTVEQSRKSTKQILLTTLMCLFLVGLMIAQLGSTYPIYVMTAFPLLGMTAVSILYLLDTFLIVFTQVPLTHWLHRYNKIHVMGVGAFLMGLGMLVLSFSSFFSLALISCLLWTTGEMLFIPMAQLLCYESGGNKKKGQSMGWFQSTYATSAVLGPLLGGFIYTRAGGNVLWYGSAVFGVLSLLSCYYLSLKTSAINPR